MDIEKFLAAHGQSGKSIDIRAATDEFIKEMEEGLCGRGSLPMLATYLPAVFKEDITPTDKKIILDAGGTNFRSALGYFDKEGNAVFGDIEKCPMPASGEKLTAEEFYGAIAEKTSRLLPKGGDIGYCFSYPVKMGEDLDGIAEDMSKELSVEGLVGTKVGERTLAAIKKLDKRERRIVILNDSVATLIGNTVKYGKTFSACTGYIYGTGTNVCCEGDVNGRKMIINTECGNYDKFPAGDFDRQLFSQTANPESQKFEKMTSGKYLADLIRLCLEGAAREGILHSGRIGNFDLADVSGFLEGGKGKIAAILDVRDLPMAEETCKILIDRAAKMGAIANAAAIKFSSDGSPLPAAVFAEGTTFMRLYGYSRAFNGYLESLLEKGGCKVIAGKDSNLTGALAATVKLKR